MNIYNGIALGYLKKKKKENLTLSNSMDGPEEHYAK